MKKEELKQYFDRRDFLKVAGLGVGAGMLGMSAHHVIAQDKKPKIQGFDDTGSGKEAGKVWTPVSDRKVRVGLVGYGVCQFSAGFGFQDHPNVEVVAVSDLIPERCAQLAQHVKCNKTYPSLEEMVKDKTIEAIFVATDAPSHARHCIEVLNHGKHVACAVPAVWGSLKDAQNLFETVKRTGLKYMMFETSMFHDSLWAMRQIHKAGGFGQLIYTEAEYWHYSKEGVPSYNDWRHGAPVQWYPTHSDAYYVGVTNGSFLEVSCMGIPSELERYQPKNNTYKNSFATEISLYRCSDGSMARMGRSDDTMGPGCECGRLRGSRGAYVNHYMGDEKNLPDVTRPPLPPGVPEGGHGGSHGRLTEEFIRAILEDRKPLVDVAMALNMTVGGIIAHQSALKDGELLKIPQFKF